MAALSDVEIAVLSLIQEETISAKLSGTKRNIESEWFSHTSLMRSKLTCSRISSFGSSYSGSLEPAEIINALDQLLKRGNIVKCTKYGIVHYKIAENTVICSNVHQPLSTPIKKLHEDSHSNIGDEVQLEPSAKIQRTTNSSSTASSTFSFKNMFELSAHLKIKDTAPESQAAKDKLQDNADVLSPQPSNNSRLTTSSLSKATATGKSKCEEPEQFDAIVILRMHDLLRRQRLDTKT